MPSEVKYPSGSLQKLMGLASSILRRRFNPSKCKTEANLVSARIKLLRNRREMQVRQMRRDIAILLQSGQEDTARIRVEHVIREQNVMAANEVINLFCELIVVRLPIIQKQRDCPPDLKEAISSVIYAAPRCSDIPELCRIRDIFEKKYGKDFVSAAADLRPESGVNRMLIEKLSIRKPAGEVKLKVMEEIAKEFKIQWDATETKNELLKPPEELLEGPRTFISASSFPIKPNIPAKELQQNEPILSEATSMCFMDTASTAQAAAEPANQAYLAQQTSNGSRRNSLNSTGSTTRGFTATEPKDSGRRFSSQGFHVTGHMKKGKDDAVEINDEKIQGRNSYSGHQVYGGIKFDDSDGLDSENEIEFPGGSQNTSGSHEPPESNCSVNSLPRVHPKLPDYEKLAARFEALKSRKS